MSSPDPLAVLPAPQETPEYCQYVEDPCNQTFHPAPSKRSIFCAYPSDPPQIAEAIENAVEALRHSPQQRWTTWRDMATQGQLIFCEICKQCRASHVVVADVTTLNFNLLYEIGFCIGLGVPVVPIRDTNFALDRAEFAKLGILDTLGYEDFRNSADLSELLPTKTSEAVPLPDVETRAFSDSPIYLVRPHVTTEGALQLESTLKKSHLRYRTHDPNEVSRLTMNDARRQVNGSLAVMCTLLPSSRQGHRVHNALCAFVAGYAMAKQKIVVLLQDGHEELVAIDYRDVVKSFTSSRQIPDLLQPSLNRVYDVLQTGRFTSRETNDLGILRDLDLGDVAAENEILGLQHYFLPTGPSINAQRGHARLVVGRKGSGKTAIFYEVRNTRSHGIDQLVLDLKPEGHQFLRLREFVQGRMTPGLQEYTLTAFWTYILLTEIGRKLLEADDRVARRDPARFKAYQELDDVYLRHDPGEEADFSQRLYGQVNRILRQLEGLTEEEMAERMTQVIYAGDVRNLRKAVSQYIGAKESVWLLIDNLDKGWPIQGSTDTDILLIRSLLEATRKLQQMLESEHVEFKCLLFLRTDIYEHLQRSIPDKGKDTAIRVEWEDPEAFESLIERRIQASTDLTGNFRGNIWPAVCVPLVGAEDSFSYIVDRTLMRPRDLLMFLHRAISTAINRGHSRVLEDDIRFAETGYSNEMLANTEAEIVDTNPELDGVLGAFQGVAVAMALEDAVAYVQLHLDVADEATSRETVRKLVWYGFLGVKSPVFNDVQYSFSFPDFRRLTDPLDNDDATLIVHPAFRSGLNIAG